MVKLVGCEANAAHEERFLDSLNNGFTRREVLRLAALAQDSDPNRIVDYS